MGWLIAVLVVMGLAVEIHLSRIHRTLEAIYEKLPEPEEAICETLPEPD